MKPSADPLVLKQSPFIGDPHPRSPQWRAVNIRLLDNADVEGKVVYMGPLYGKMVETFVLKAAA